MVDLGDLRGPSTGGSRQPPGDQHLPKVALWCAVGAGVLGAGLALALAMGWL